MKVIVGALVALGSLFAAREAAAACQGRPTDTGGFIGYDYGAAEVKSYAGAKVRVHYATSGTHAPTLMSTRPDAVPDTVAYAAETGDGALAQYATMGYQPVPSDAACASNGGDEKVDIYLVHFTAADGSTFAECPGAGTAGCSSFALVESKFLNKGYANAQEGFRTVVTHELFHAVQNTYKLQEAPFWAEGTAQWAMKHVHPELADFEHQLSPFFAEPTRSIDSAPSGVTSGFLYGSAIWPLFLSLRHGDETIRAVFEAEADGNKDPLPAIDAVLETKGSSLAEDYPLFGAWNVGTGKLPSAGGYPDAAKYPGVKTSTLQDGAGDITSGLGYFPYRGTLAAAQQITLDTDATRNAGVVVPIEDGTLQLGKAQKLPANASGEVVVVVSGITTKKSDAPFTIHFADPVAETPDAGASSSGYTTTTRTTSGEEGGCRTASSSGTSAGAGLFALVALLAVRSRRRS